MKYFFILLTFLIFASGCSEKNAFTHFTMTKEQELGVSSLKSTKVLTVDGRIYGVVTSVYLNTVYPETYNDREYFYVYYYLKKPNLDLNMTLNKLDPISKEELKRENNFTKLTSVKSDWNKYYIVSFPHDSNETLSLVFENNQSSPALLRYQTGE